ncbi:MAG: Uma2 family endonuclease, partial [Gemmatimonadaceae bacterium]
PRRSLGESGHTGPPRRGRSLASWRRVASRRVAERAPDLVVELLSPDERPGKVCDTVADWQRAGTHLVWVVDPVSRTARMHLADGREGASRKEGALDGGAVLPGLRIRLSAVLS